jgi:hypothetical protein
MSARILVIDDEESIRFTFDRFRWTEGHMYIANLLSSRHLQVG